MKRLHVHFTVADLDRAIVFYSGLFGQPPKVRHDDYAKWMVDDPCVNFAVSTGARQNGFDHLGIQVEDEDELEEIEARLRQVDATVEEQRGAQCCYAVGDKSWTVDPDGTPWETFLPRGEIEEYGPDLRPRVNR